MSRYKELPFAPTYKIDYDGNLVNQISGLVIKKSIIKGKTDGKYYYRYMLGDKTRYLVNRLVMFMFGEHDYATIDEMPKVVLLDGNPENSNINNLAFSDQSSINKRYGIRLDPKYSIKQSRIPITELENIKKYLSLGQTYEAIGDTLGVSKHSVYRFIKKHIK